MAIIRFAFAVVIAMAFASSAPASDWTTHEAEEAGYSMLVPEGASPQPAPEGWMGLQIKHRGIALAGMAKEGAKAEDMEAEVARISGMSPDSIEIDDEGKGDGWQWFKAIYATEGGKVLLGIYGESESEDDGSRKGYVFVLLTTEDDFDSNEDLYYDWFESIQIF